MSLLKCGHLWNYLSAWSREFRDYRSEENSEHSTSCFDWVSTHLHEDVDHKALWLAWLNEVRQLTGDGGVGFLFCDVHDVSCVPLFAGWMHFYPVGKVSTPTSCSLRRIKSFNVDYQRCERLEAGGFFQGDDPTAQVISFSPRVGTLLVIVCGLCVWNILLAPVLSSAALCEPQASTCWTLWFQCSCML